MSGEDIAAEVASALREVGDEVGDGPYEIILRQQVNSGTEWSPTRTPTDTTLVVIEDTQRLRDGSGTLTTQTRRTLTTEAPKGVTITDEDTVSLDGGTSFENILEVRPLNLAGVVLLWELELKT